MVAITSPRLSRRIAGAELVKMIGSDATESENAHIRRARSALKVYFHKDPRVNFSNVELDTELGTDFEREVWHQLRMIPPGETRTYGEIARRLRRPHAARAVGRCNAKNPWSIVVPCHRLVGSDGSLTGYCGGLKMKRRLLELEGIDVTALRAKMLAAATRRKRTHADRD